MTSGTVCISTDKYDKLVRTEKAFERVLRGRYVKQYIDGNGYMWHHYFMNRHEGRLVADALNKVTELQRKVRLLETDKANLQSELFFARLPWWRKLW